MVKVAFVSAAVAILAPLAAADNCRNGLRYCGHNLLDLGNYRLEIEDALRAAGQSTVNEDSFKSSLFQCSSGGKIRWLQYCGPNNWCINAGRGNNDLCAR